MKQLILLFAAILSSYSYSCSDLLNSELRVLDSSEKRNMCEYKGDVLLVVNVASRCGYTYQYEGLQALYDKYKDQGLTIIGIPSRDFRQEYSEESSVAEFCSTEYGVNFPMFATTKVRGDKAHPFYKKLSAQSGMTPNWNFNKYLIDRNGKVYKGYRAKVKPDSDLLINSIEKLL
jgi:glutathione peroxidase